jgi:hypothetical protein
MRDKPHSLDRSDRRRARATVAAAASVSIIVAIGVVLISLAHHGRDTTGSASSRDAAVQARASSAAPSMSPITSASPHPRRAKSARSRAAHHRGQVTTAPGPNRSPAPTQAGSPVARCASDPHTCGYPDSTNTGVAAGAPLRNVPGQETRGSGWRWQTDHIVVTSNGATVSDLNIDGWVEIDANNVTLDNLNVTSTGDGWGVGLYCQDRSGGNKGCAGSVIENTSIGGPNATGPSRLEVGIKDVYGDAVGTRISRVNIYHASTSIQISNGVIEDSYIHDFGYNSSEGDHLNGISVGGGDSRPLLIQHNTVFNNYGQTDAIALFQDFGPEANKTIDDNLLAGGGYALIGGGPNGCTGPASAYKCDPSSNIVITNNLFSTIFTPLSGYYGPVANFNSAGTGNVWSGNRWAGGHRAGHIITP